VAAVVVLSLAVATFPAAAAPAGGPPRILLVVRQAAGAGLDTDALLLVGRAALTALQMDSAVRSAGILLVDGPDTGAPATDDSLTGSAVTQAADGWVALTVNATGPQGARVHVRSVAIAGEDVVIDQDVTVNGSLSATALAETDWSPIASLLAHAYQTTARRPPAAPLQGSVRLVIHGRPGTSVSVRGGPSARLDAGGSASLELHAPGQYDLHASAAGYVPQTQRLFLTANREISLDLRPDPRWALSLSVVDLGYPGASLGWVFVPDKLFVSLGFTTFVAGLALDQQEVISSRPLTNFLLQAGAYILPTDAAVRPYFTFGGFVRFVDSAAYVGLDPLSPWGLQFVLGAELGGQAHGKLFLEWTPQLFVTQYATFLQASLGTGSTPPGWSFFGTGAADILTLRIGYRWLL